MSTQGNGKWNDIHQGWTGPAVYRFAGKPQWYWEESAERLRNHSNLKPGTNFVPYSSNDNDKLEEMHDAASRFAVDGVEDSPSASPQAHGAQAVLSVEPELRRRPHQDAADEYEHGLC